MDPLREDRVASPYDPMSRTKAPGALPETLAHVPAPAGRPGAETRGRLALVATLFVCFVAAVFVVNRYAVMTQENYRLIAMQQEVSHAKSQSAALQAQVYSLSSPSRILWIAEHVLKMQPAAPVAVGTAGR